MSDGYVHYAHSLSEWGQFSAASSDLSQPEMTIGRAPLYPLFLALAMQVSPSYKDMAACHIKGAPDCNWNRSRIVHVLQLVMMAGALLLLLSSAVVVGTPAWAAGLVAVLAAPELLKQAYQYRMSEGLALPLFAVATYGMMRLAQRGWNVAGIDIESSAVDQARDLLRQQAGVIRVEVGSIYSLEPGALQDYALVVCCEVLEHLPDPQQGLACLHASGARNLILSVPREPLWRTLNVARGSYLADLGNTPGHLNHWSSSGFRRFVSERFEIKTVRQPLPWTFVHAQRQDLR